MGQYTQPKWASVTQPKLAEFMASPLSSSRYGSGTLTGSAPTNLSMSTVAPFDTGGFSSRQHGASSF